MKRALYNGLAASSAAFALTFTGCGGAETVNHIPLTNPSYADALGAMGVNCAKEMLGGGASFDVVPTVVGSTVVLETQAKTFTFAGKQEVQSNEVSVLGAIASGDVKIVSWENRNAQGSTAGVHWTDGAPTELLVGSSQGTDASTIIGAACTSSLK